MSLVYYITDSINLHLEIPLSETPRRTEVSQALDIVDSAKQPLRVSHIRSGCSCSYRVCGRFCGRPGSSRHKHVYHHPDISFPPPAQKCIQAGRAVSDHHTLPFWHRKHRAAFFPSHHMMPPVFHQGPCARQAKQPKLHFPLVSSIHPATQTGHGKAAFSCSSCWPAQQCHSLCRGTA